MCYLGICATMNFTLMVFLLSKVYCELYTASYIHYPRVIYSYIHLWHDLRRVHQDIGYRTVQHPLQPLVSRIRRGRLVGG